MNRNGIVPSSFRDPSGFLFYREGILYRQINKIYQEDYDHLMHSGLYGALIEAELLIPHEETDIQNTWHDAAVYKIIKPEPVPFISYPYEWCFSQLKDAALITLQIQKVALQFGMSIKDASAFNVQFTTGKPIFIDTLSFEKYKEGEPWVAYRQFCQHFLAPLALMGSRDIRLNQLLRIYIDGIPLDLASRLLTFTSWLKLSLLTHIHLHSRSQRYYADKAVNIKSMKVGKQSIEAIVDNLASAVNGVKWQPQDSEWSEYYTDTNYPEESLEHKKQIVSEVLDRIKPQSVWDLGANTGLFSRLASKRKIQTIAFDMDPVAVENNYLDCKKRADRYLLPLCLDLTNPSPNIGWNHQERMSWEERGPADMILALALVHHLAIANNVPLEKIAHSFSRLCKFLVIEYVPKSDSQVMRLLKNRADIFSDYSREAFEEAFTKYFEIQDSVTIRKTERTVYFMNVGAGRS